MIKKTILIIDDDTGIVDLMTRFFENEDCHVISCGDGQSALQILEKEKPHLVFLDINLPRVNGLTVLHCADALSRKERPCPVIIITGERNLEALLKGQKVAGVMYKPFSLKELEEKVDQVLNGRS